MELVFTDIWTHLRETLNFTIVLIVIASGYLLGRGPIGNALFTKIPKTGRIVIVSLPLAILYGLLTDLDAGVILASFFISFGFHAVILKFIEGFIPKK